LDREGEWWKVVWDRPVIIGSFDIWGHLARGVNASNATIEPFALNITRALVNSLEGVMTPDFRKLNIYHMWESPDFLLKGWETGFPSLWKTHIFKIEYELIVWDINMLQDLQRVLTNILDYFHIVDYGSHRSEREAFAEQLWVSVEFFLTELYPNTMPLTYNETMVAPNWGLDAASHTMPSAFLIWLLLSGSLSIGRTLAGQC